jgi:hypothetical protein
MGCLIQLAAALERTGTTSPPAAHRTIELLDASLRDVPLR